MSSHTHSETDKRLFLLPIYTLPKMLVPQHSRLGRSRRAWTYLSNLLRCAGRQSAAVSDAAGGGAKTKANLSESREKLNATTEEIVHTGEQSQQADCAKSADFTEASTTTVAEGRCAQQSQPTCDQPDTNVTAAAPVPNGSVVTSAENLFEFRWPAAKTIDCSVFVCGTFNNWNDQELKLRRSVHGDEYSVWRSLPTGEHQFKFVVDGRWVHCDLYDTCDDQMGGYNNVVHIK